MLREFIVTFPWTAACALVRIVAAVFALLLGITVGFVHGCRAAGFVLMYGVDEADKMLNAVRRRKT